LSAAAERYGSAGRVEKGRILDALCRTTGWHRKHAVRALRRRVIDKSVQTIPSRRRKGRYGVVIKDALTALWEASDRVCGKRLVVMIPTLVPALARHGRLQLSEVEQAQLLAVSAATIDRMLGDVKVAAAGGRRRRAGFYSAIRREVPIRTFDDWKDPAPGYCEVDMVAHGGTSVAGSFIQTLTMVDVATGWTECLPLVTREGNLVVDAIKRAQGLFPWLPWCRLRQRQCVHERGRCPLVSRADARSDAIACLQEERPGFRRAEERCSRPAIDGVWPIPWRRDGAGDGSAVRGGTALRELLPAVVQAEGKAARRRQSDQTLSRSVHAGHPFQIDTIKTPARAH
jgi:hypothetical protein